MRNNSRGKVVVTIMVAAVVVLIAMMSVANLAAEDMTLSILNAEDTCAVVNEFGEVVNVTPSKTKVITTTSTNNNATYLCEVKDFGNDTGSAITYSYGDVFSGTHPIPVSCIIPGNITTNWHETISAGGNLKLTCQFNDNQS